MVLVACWILLILVHTRTLPVSRLECFSPLLYLGCSISSHATCAQPGSRPSSIYLSPSVYALASFHSLGSTPSHSFLHVSSLSKYMFLSVTLAPLHIASILSLFQSNLLTRLVLSRSCCLLLLTYPPPNIFFPPSTNSKPTLGFACRNSRPWHTSSGNAKSNHSRRLHAPR